MAFPFETSEETEENLNIPAEYGIDFETGRLTGGKVTGLEAIKVWVYMALRIPRYRNIIYSWDFGNELEDLIGKGYSHEYLESEIPRMITECLLINPYINEVMDFTVKSENDKLTVNFTIATIYGNEVINLVR